MKNFLGLLVFALVHFGLSAQTNDAIIEKIKVLEQQEMKAVIEQDYDALSILWAPDFMVNNPFNMVVKSRKEVLERMAKGIIHYSDFNRKTESFMVLEGIVIVMGEETVVPIEGAPMAGETVIRRYTNIWREVNGNWQVQARHANIVCGEK